MSVITIRPAPLPTVDDYRIAVEALLDAVARSRRYDNALSISTYVSSTTPQWAVEATAFVAWRDTVWVYAYAELDKMMTSQRPQPLVSDFLAELPSLTWPT